MAANAPLAVSLWMGAVVASATGLLHLVGGAAVDLPAQSGGILGQLAGRSMRDMFGGMGGNLFLFVLLMLSVTLATGLSWFALMDWIGGKVLQLIALGNSNLEIADRLYISLHTVKTHARRIHSKLGVERRTQAVAKAKTLGLMV